MNDIQYHELDKRIELVAEQMNTKQAEYESAIDRLRADMAHHNAEMAKRETRQLAWVAAIVGLGVAALGLWLSFLVSSP